MPTPTAVGLYSPLTTLIFVLTFSSGSRLLPSFMSAPLPLAHQWLPLMPLPMNSTATRCGNALAAAPAAPDATAPAEAVGVAPHTGIDSSHGSAIVTPAPCRNVRRETPRV